MDNNHQSIQKSDVKVHSFSDKEELKNEIEIFLNNQDIKTLYIICNDLELAFKEFQKLYKLIEAAGGLVKNNSNQFLVIHRRGKWDLPKGKLEKEETPEVGALREVEEECGISNLEIQKQLEITYHTYTLNEKDILKRTYWFEMFYSDNQNPTPQTEEDITEVKWINQNEIDEFVNNTFPSIIEVLKKSNMGDW